MPGRSLQKPKLFKCLYFTRHSCSSQDFLPSAAVITSKACSITASSTSSVIAQRTSAGTWRGEPRTPAFSFWRPARCHDGQFGFFDQLQRQILDGGLVAQPDATDCQSNEAQQHQCDGDGRRDEVQHSSMILPPISISGAGSHPCAVLSCWLYSDVSQVLGSPGNGLPAGRTTDAVHGQSVRLLRLSAERSRCPRRKCRPGVSPSSRWSIFVAARFASPVQPRRMVGRMNFW